MSSGHRCHQVPMILESLLTVGLSQGLEGSALSASLGPENSLMQGLLRAFWETEQQPWPPPSRCQ